MLSKLSSKVAAYNRFTSSKYYLNFYREQIRSFTNTTIQPTKKSYGGLKDSDRIFTNLYRDNDPFIEGALKRVNLIK